MNKTKNTSQEETDPLAQPIKINNLKIKNRFVKSATNENMVDQQGIITQQYIDYYSQLSNGGVGLIITGHMHVDINGRNRFGMTSADSEDQIPFFKKVADAVHKNGAAIFGQLNHAGLKGIPEKDVDKKIIAPSKTVWATPMNIKEIEETIENFGRSASLIKKGGFDGIQIQGAHAYLIEQFLSKRMNHRRDRYGGSLENRQRFLFEVYESVRDHVGKSFPIIVKLDSTSRSYASTPPMIQLIPLKEALITAKKLEDVGIDAIEVTCGFFAVRGAYPYKTVLIATYKEEKNYSKAAMVKAFLTPFDMAVNRNIWFKPHHNIKHIKLFKEKFEIPILASSCFRDPAYMRKVIENNEADMICLARPLIYNPNFPNEILKGSSTPSRCINCNLCMFLLTNRLPLQCYHGKVPSSLEI